MDNHPIENLMKSTMENLKDMIDVNTIVGDAVEAKDGTLIIPISKVSFGFASGGSEFENKNAVSSSSSPYPFGGGSGAGVTVKPVAFLVTKQDSVKLLSLDQQNTYDKIIDSFPQVMDFIENMTKKKDTKNQKKDPEKKEETSNQKEETSNRKEETSNQNKENS